MHCMCNIKLFHQQNTINHIEIIMIKIKLFFLWFFYDSTIMLCYGNDLRIVIITIVYYIFVQKNNSILHIDINVIDLEVRSR